MLLERGPNAREAVEEILSSPTLYAEAKAVMFPLVARAEPCGEAFVVRVIEPHLVTYPQPDRSEAEWRLFWAPYKNILKKLPAEAVALAMEDWVRSEAEFLPKPGQLLKLAEKHAEPICRAAYRAKLLAKASPKPKLDRGTAEERRAYVAEQMKGYARPEPPPPPPSAFTPTPTDERGLSAEMRARIHRDRA